MKIEENDFLKIADEVETLAGLILELKGEMPAKMKESIMIAMYLRLWLLTTDELRK